MIQFRIYRFLGHGAWENFCNSINEDLYNKPWPYVLNPFLEKYNTSVSADTDYVYFDNEEDYIKFLLEWS